MKYLLTILLIISALSLKAQNDSVEFHRNAGYEARINGDLDESIKQYSLVLKSRPNDYDAKLALARLWFYKGEFNNSIAFYHKIYSTDKTDVEALFGLGKSFTNLGELDSAVFYLKRAIIYLPDHVPLYLALAKAYSWQGELDSAIAVYFRANDVDNTYSEVWAGIGRMHYWKSQPVSAVKYYRKALELDSGNTEIRTEYENIHNQIKYKVRISGQYINEDEESYVIDALVQSYSVSKRVTDRWNLTAGFMLDHSDRDFENDIGDTTRWYDNTSLRAMWISDYHVFNVYAGYSNSDSRVTAYGLSYNYRKRFKNFRLTNTITGDYSYFYYWNEMGRFSLRDNFTLTIKRFEIYGGINVGKVDDAYIMKYYGDSMIIGQNPFLSYKMMLKYTLVKKPAIKIGFVHSYMDFDNLSPQYYTPYQRLLTGGDISLYHKFKKLYFFGQYTFSLGTEVFYNEISVNQYEENKINVDNWTARVETGYDFGLLSFAMGASRFYNPFYKNFIGYFALNFNL